MRVNTNSTALSASVELDFNSQIIEKLSERLSSGQRINKAADDPSGLAISENMLAQVQGTNMGVQNIQDTVSLLQTAEGGMQSIMDSIQRIRVLSVQAANDTYTDDQRQGMQAEIDQLKQHIDQVAKQTQFNGVNLLDGTFNVQFVPNPVRTGNYLTDSSLDFQGGFDTAAMQFTAPGSPTSVSTDISQRIVPFGFFRDNNLSVLQRLQTAINSSGSVTATLLTDPTGTQHAMQMQAANGGTFSFAETGVPAGTMVDVAGLNNQGMVQEGNYLVVQAGADANQTVQLMVPNMTVAALGLGSVNVVSTSNAESAIAAIDQVVQTVGGDLSVIGAGENRLQQASQAQQSAAERMTASYSNLVDSNVAQDASNWTKANIVQQNAEQVLSQAITTTNGLSVLTVDGLKQRFPLVGAHLGG